MKFLGQAFENLEQKQDRQTHKHTQTETDRRKRMHYSPNSPKSPIPGRHWRHE